MKTTRKKFILQAHEAACSDWKSKIATEFPKLFKGTKLVVGSWYKTTQFELSYLINITELFFDKYYKGSISQRHYGFENGEFKKGSWNNTAFSKSLIPATDKEVETALFAEAKKRGYKEGVTIESFSPLEPNIIESDYKGGYYKGGYYMDGCCVFDNGKWATIIPKIKEMTLVQVQNQLGYAFKIIKYYENRNN